MKDNKYNYIILVLLIFSFEACTLQDFKPEEWAIDPELELSDNYIVFSSIIGTQKVSVLTNYDSFTAKTEAEWCHVFVNVDSMYLDLEVEPNQSVEQRVTTVQITISKGNKTLTKNLTVVQVGGYWDTIGNFNVFWQHEISIGQREAIVDLIQGLKLVEGGTFIMGDSVNAHWVTLSSFYISTFEVTQKQWNAIMGKNPALFRGENLPIENITWTDALDFVNHLSDLTNLDFELPTEAQWEYAAKGGRFSLGYTYPGSNDYTEVAHFIDPLTSKDSPLYTTKEGGTKKPNELGLYDMAGNVAEYCFDWYDDNYNSVTTDQDPTGAETGTYKVVRGGYFAGPYLQYGVTWRSFSGVNRSEGNIGFRIVLRL